ncbi:hypothetical protein HNR39_000942 [Glaciimonas immobilis]|uniref:Uncharacterized protein n=1 Tax=Glaciimonas immobilis TaxID=728004 RepID=A0A840RN50_9BURK|nr:hypothetical protein [Glaciimonas immobilis]
MTGIALNDSQLFIGVKAEIPSIQGKTIASKVKDSAQFATRLALASHRARASHHSRCYAAYALEELP